MKKIRLVVVLILISAFLAAALSACGSGSQSTDIAGTYESGGVTYELAEDMSAAITENGETKYGFYSLDGRSIEIRLDGETLKYDYTYEGDSLSLFAPGSIFGVVYKRTADSNAGSGMG